MLTVQVRQAGELALETVPTPRCGAHEYLLKVRRCAICGTDVKIMSHGHRLARYPVVPGHEFAATIEAVGDAVKAQGYPFQEGDNVVMSPGVPCGRCPDCLGGRPDRCVKKTGIGFQIPGGFAEYIALPEQAALGFLKIPPSMDMAEASLMEPLACCIHGQERLRLTPWDTVVIIGGGAIGAFHAELARIHGAARIIVVDILDSRLSLLEKLSPGITTVNSARRDPVAVIKDLTGGDGADKVIIACPAREAYPLAFAACRTEGSLLFFSGLPPNTENPPVDANAIHYGQLTVLGAFGSTRSDHRKSLDILARGAINAGGIITHRVGLDRIRDALDLLRRGEALKVVLLMHEEHSDI